MQFMHVCVFREVTEEEGMAKAKRLSAHHIETSAKTGLNVRQLFTRLAQTLPGAEGSGIPENAMRRINNRNVSCMNSSSLPILPVCSDRRDLGTWDIQGVGSGWHLKVRLLVGGGNKGIKSSIWYLVLYVLSSAMKGLG